MFGDKGEIEVSSGPFIMDGKPLLTVLAMRERNVFIDQWIVVEPSLPQTGHPDAEAVQFCYVSKAGRGAFTGEPVDVRNEQNPETLQAGIPQRGEKRGPVGTGARLFVEVLPAGVALARRSSFTQLLDLVRHVLASVVGRHASIGSRNDDKIQ